MTTDWLLPLSILGSSFVGSLHCTGMCGPIATFAANKNQLWSYHLGRGLSYTTLGIISGAFGSFFLQHDLSFVRLAAGFLFALLLIFYGVRTLRGKAVHLPNWFPIQKVITKNSSGFSLGLLTALFPCGWLFSYVLAAGATQSPWAGALVMLLFWLGGIPALSVLPIFMKKTIQLSNSRQQKIAGIVLIVAGVYSVFSFYFFQHLM